MKSFERFVTKYNKYAIKNLVAYIILGNAVLYILQLFGKLEVQSLLSFNRDAILNGQIWRLLTFVFIPPSSWGPVGLIITLIFFYWIGINLERAWGSLKFNIYYLVAMAATLAVGFLFPQAQDFVGAQFINLSILLAFATLFPDFQIMFFFVIPLKMKYVAFIDIAAYVYFAVTAPFPINMLPIVALANYFLFFTPHFIRMLNSQRPGFTRDRHNERDNIVKFKKRQYYNKCVVCGRNDVDNKELEFRYCTKCDGAYCYCSEHLYDHEHIKKD